MKIPNLPEPSGKPRRVIFRASVKLPDGTKIYARDYGLRGFPIPIY